MCVLGGFPLLPGLNEPVAHLPLVLLQQHAARLLVRHPKLAEDRPDVAISQASTIKPSSKSA